MKSVPKLISRFIGLLILSILLLLAVNLILAIVVFQQQFSEESSFSSSPYTYTHEIASAVTKSASSYQLDNEMLVKLKSDNVWGMIIDEDSKKVVWQTADLPVTISESYSLSDISNLTLGYIEDYPTYVSEVKEGLLVLGFPKTSYWKLMRPTWSYRFITNVPQLFLIIFTVNLMVVLMIYLWFSGKLIRSVTPILEGIRNLSTGQHKEIPTKGVLSEIAENINQTSKILEEQEKQLNKKESARADWITGISHDIRTPLSMAVGYASQLSNSPSLSIEERKKAKIILNQSYKIKQLVNDLNLSSKLEYSMQPINMKKVNLLSLIRQVIVDFINNNLDENYLIHWQSDEESENYFILADEELIKRAIINVIQNAINHNPDGCNIYVAIQKKNQMISLHVADDGIGVSESQLNQLNNISHDILNREKQLENRHGLGLLIVRQIIDSHKGKVTLGISPYGGFSVSLTLPKYSNN